MLEGNSLYIEAIALQSAVSSHRSLHQRRARLLPLVSQVGRVALALVIHSHSSAQGEMLQQANIREGTQIS